MFISVFGLPFPYFRADRESLDRITNDPDQLGDLLRFWQEFFGRFHYFVLENRDAMSKQSVQSELVRAETILSNTTQLIALFCDYELKTIDTAPLFAVAHHLPSVDEMKPENWRKSQRIGTLLAAHDVISRLWAIGRLRGAKVEERTSETQMRLDAIILIVSRNPGIICKDIVPELKTITGVNASEGTTKRDVALLRGSDKELIENRSPGYFLTQKGQEYLPRSYWVAKDIGRISSQ